MNAGNCRSLWQEASLEKKPGFKILEPWENVVFQTIRTKTEISDRKKGNLRHVQFSKRQIPKSVLAAECGPLACYNRIARPPSPQGSAPNAACGTRHLKRANLTFGKLPLGKLHIWEVATWEIVSWEVAFGKMQTPWTKHCKISVTRSFNREKKNGFQWTMTLEKRCITNYRNGNIR